VIYFFPGPLFNGHDSKRTAVIYHMSDISFADGPCMCSPQYQVRPQPVAAKVTYDETPSPLAQHIVYIVDESVRGDYIQLNNKNLSNTPFLSRLDAQLINFGVATSAANCNLASRTMLRHATRQNAPDAGTAALHQLRRTRAYLKF
jgi:hypothetical protein